MDGFFVNYFSGSSKNSSRSSTVSSSTVISASEIQSLVDKLRNQGNRSSTRQNYYGIWRNFNEFFIKLDHKPASWEERLTLFVGHLINNSIKSNTIKCYISAIKSVLREDGVELNEDRSLLSALKKACRYHNNRTVKTCMPIQKNLLNQLIYQIDYSLEENEGQTYLAKLYKAMFMSAYYGLLRVSEITSGENLHPIKLADVQVAMNKKKIMFILRTSKTHWRDNKP